MRRAGKVKLVGVTLLTSHDEKYLRFLKTGFGSVREMVLHLSCLAKDAGLYGVVCSPLEVKAVKELTGLFTVVPGVRISGRADDQRRFSTPREAVRDGADMIVMGRDIYRSGDPEGVVRHVLESIGDREDFQGKGL
ncbi:MAG: orotidine 5'-phosphate decarboxylase / HUMPS family protein [Aquificota bacterium]|nr:orotidine 5'-phosphate decarboxylase / HUMPS family protein [Aquificota bacterium]